LHCAMCSTSRLSLCESAAKLSFTNLAGMRFYNWNMT
jgi:hypothetical protein